MTTMTMNTPEEALVCRCGICGTQTSVETDTKRKRYDVISPDGFTIRIGVPPFISKKERRKYFEWWKKRLKQQGYYSSVPYGRIHLDDLEDFCEWIELKPGQRVF